jgi:hypothetical protein
MVLTALLPPGRTQDWVVVTAVVRLLLYLGDTHQTSATVDIESDGEEEDIVPVVPDVVPGEEDMNPSVWDDDRILDDLLANL